MESKDYILVQVEKDVGLEKGRNLFSLDYRLSAVSKIEVPRDVRNSKGP